MLGVQTSVTSENGNYRFPAVPPGTYVLTLSSPGSTPSARRHPDHAGLHRQHEHRDGAGDARGDRDGHGRLARHRHDGDARRAELQDGPAAVDPERARHVVAAGGDAVGADDAHRRGRQPRRHADRLLGVRLDRPGAGADRGHQHDGRHGRRRLLLRLLVARGSVPRHVGPVGGDAEPGRAEPVHRQVGRQHVLGRGVPRLVQQLAAGLEHPGRVHGAGRGNGNPIREGSNEIEGTTTPRSTWAARSCATRCGGSARTARRRTPVSQPNFNFDQTFDTTLWNPVGKVTYQANQNNKIIAYYQWGQKVQPTRLPFGNDLHLQLAEQTFAGLGQLGVEGRVERHGQRQAVRRGALRRRSATTSRCSPTATRLLLARLGPLLEGAHQRWQIDRERKQATARGHVLPRHRARQPHAQVRRRDAAEQGWKATSRAYGGNIDHLYNNGVSSQVIFGCRRRPRSASLKAARTAT
jgi:hypothetical protein